MNKNFTHYYMDHHQKILCRILSIQETFGSSILNHHMASMDYTKTTYYTIELENGEVFQVTKQFLKKIGE